MIQLQHVSFNYQRQEVLSDISLLFPLGQTIGIAGENGSGKSTLLKIIAGIQRPRKGTISIHNESLTRIHANDIAYLPDTDLFYSFYTTKELLAFYASQFKDFSVQKALEVANFLEVDVNVKLKKLSKGNRGRAKMAATLGRNTSYYVMDEPFSGLDPIVRESLIKGLIQFVNMEEQSIILSTHELHDVEPILDQLIVLKQGKVIAQDDLETIRFETNQDAVSWMKYVTKEKVK
ncbi:ABC transporter ATP-binding protein [Psychrobacillus antarcticus]|uniref:ATP-binding cassette domain-containing protein n=1 Tax=Psychrobacillus antarcticus TaxID=2879115 RepID=UPI0024077F24|nr:ABC transporter ATP-binding protein [Psychrobacillus antarcticus]